MKNIVGALVAIFLIISCSNERPQEPDPVRRKSPIAITNVTHPPTDSYIKIVYGQPYKRDRAIFGDLVPYGEVWRTGANEATELTTTRDIRVNNQRLEAGTYALFSIPGEKEWTIILNDSLGQWGAFDYNEQYDRLRTRVTPQRDEQLTETFTIRFAEIIDDSTAIVMRWDTSRVEIPVQFIGQ